MAIHPGMRIGPYEVIAAIGAGGMGEVYRARDTRLDRPVAIKVLPDALANDRERLARFEREAKTLASLNHTNIAQIYGIEGNALAMEFVEGEDLSAQIARGPMPVDEALAIARQIADALDAAHGLGIVHRDLKPSNIRVRDDDVVKVLDFGLSKTLAPVTQVSGAASAATVTSPALTALGAILGTAVYMAPEQAKGKPVDRRVDIWAFGVVLYEMVTGRRPFDGESVSEVLAAVLKSEPDWSLVPQRLRRLLESCLQKDSKLRLRDIGDWTRLVDEPRASTARAPGRAWPAWSAAAILLLAVGALGVIHFNERPAALTTLRFQIPPPPGQTFENYFAVAPNGRHVAFIARDEKGTTRLWVRDFDALESRAIAGTEDARNLVWKPDSLFVAFAAGNALKKVSITGGPVVTICETSPIGLGAWTPSGIILISGVTNGVIRQVPESGGAITPVTALDKTRKELVHGLPSLLPDGRHFLYIAVSSLMEQTAIFVGSLDRRPEDQDHTPILTKTIGRASFTEMGTSGGQLLFLQQPGTLMAQPFDPDRLALTGQPQPVAERVGTNGAQGLFSATTNALTYRSGVSGAGRESQLAWLDREGKTVQTLSTRGFIGEIGLSPDGRRTALTLQPDVNSDIWVLELDRDVLTKVTTSPSIDRGAVWSPDGSRIVFFSFRNRPGELFIKPANGPGGDEVLLSSELGSTPSSWSGDGQFLLYQSNGPTTANDLWVLPMQGKKVPVPLLQTEFIEASARFSPNGRWIAYQSNLSGRSEIYVRAFDPVKVSVGTDVIKVSQNGGTIPKWRRDGNEMFFEGADGGIMAADVTTTPTFRAGVPHQLFPLIPGTPWDVAPPDGKKFLVGMFTQEQRVTPITIVLNWGPAGK